MADDQQASPSSSAGAAAAASGSRNHRGDAALLSPLPYYSSLAADWQFREDDILEQMAAMNIGGGRGDSSGIWERGSEQITTQIASSLATLPSPQSSSSTLGNPHRGDAFDPYPFPLGNGGASFRRRGDFSDIWERDPEQSMTGIPSSPAPLSSPQSSSSTLGNPHRGDAFDPFPFPLGNGGASFQRRGDSSSIWERGPEQRMTGMPPPQSSSSTLGNPHRGDAFDPFPFRLGNGGASFQRQGDSSDIWGRGPEQRMTGIPSPQSSSSALGNPHRGDAFDPYPFRLGNGGASFQRRGDSSDIWGRGPEQRMTGMSSSPAPLSSPQSSSSTLGNPHRGDAFDPYPIRLGSGGASFQRRSDSSGIWGRGPEQRMTGIPSSLPPLSSPQSSSSTLGIFRRGDSFDPDLFPLGNGGASFRRLGDSSHIWERGPEQSSSSQSSLPPLSSPQSSSSTLGNPHQGDSFDPSLFPLGNAGASFHLRGPPFDSPRAQQSAAVQSWDLGFLNPSTTGAAFQSHSSYAPHLCRQELLLSSILPLNPNSKVARLCIYCAAKDSKVSKFMLQMITAGDPHIVHTIYLGIINHATELMRNPVAYQLMQRLFDVCTEEHRLSFLLILSADWKQLFSLSLHPQGTKVMQKLIETVKTNQQILLLVSAFEPIFLELIKDLNGSHVIECLLTHLPPSCKEFIFNGVATNCVQLAMDQHGCYFLQHCLNNFSVAHKENIIIQLTTNALSLALDLYGNYVIQYILKIKSPIINLRLASQFSGRYVTLSMQKFSSNVVEKCLQHFGEDDRVKIIHELLSVSQFEELLQNQYANYVIKTALKCTQGDLRAKLTTAILHHKALRNHPHCKTIFSIVLKKHWCL